LEHAVVVKAVANPFDDFHREILGRHVRLACALDSKLVRKHVLTRESPRSGDRGY
jgi:hypothetical protein